MARASSRDSAGDAGAPGAPHADPFASGGAGGFQSLDLRSGAGSSDGPCELARPPPEAPAAHSPGFGEDLMKAGGRQFSFDDEKTEDAFSSNIDPATLGPPPEWGTTSFMPPLDAPAAEPPPPVATTNTTANTDDILGLDTSVSAKASVDSDA